MDGALLVAASIVAAIRMRGDEIKSSPKLTATINDSVRLARMVMAEMDGDNDLADECGRGSRRSSSFSSIQPNVSS